MHTAAHTQWTASHSSTNTPRKARRAGTTPGSQHAHLVAAPRKRPTLLNMMRTGTRSDKTRQYSPHEPTATTITSRRCPHLVDHNALAWDVFLAKGSQKPATLIHAQVRGNGGDDELGGLQSVWGSQSCVSACHAIAATQPPFPKSLSSNTHHIDCSGQRLASQEQGLGWRTMQVRLAHNAVPTSLSLNRRLTIEMRDCSFSSLATASSCRQVTRVVAQGYASSSKQRTLCDARRQHPHPSALRRTLPPPLPLPSCSFQPSNAIRHSM
jgi:hypothetical protein